MKHALFLSVVLSLTIFAGAMPTADENTLIVRIPLERRPRDVDDAASAHATTDEQFLGAERVADLITYTHEKYSETFATYERNTGSRHPLDTLSDSSTNGLLKRQTPGSPVPGTVDLRGQGVVLWYGSLTIGTPPQHFLLDFDTGSADLVVPERRCEVTCDGHTRYNPALSSTSTTDGKPVLELYGSGGVVGVAFGDTVEVGGYQIERQWFDGVTLMSPAFWSNHFVPDGISGLAFSPLSRVGAPTLMDNLKATGRLHRPVFSFKFSDSPGKSELIIGDTNVAAYKIATLVTLPVTRPAYWQVVLGALDSPVRQVRRDVDAIIDTGTSLIVGPRGLVLDYFRDFPGARCGINGICTVPCATIDSTAPTLTFAGRPFKVSPETWNLGPVVRGSTECVAGMGILPVSFVIVGDVFLRNVYSVFDFSEVPSVQFAELT